MAQLVLLCLINLIPALSDVGQQSSELAARTFTISGRVLNSHGQPPTDLALMVGHDEGDGFSGSSEEFRPDGTFTTRGLTPGRYVLEVGPAAEPFPIPSGYEGGLVAVTVGTANLTDVVIRTHPGVSVKGRVRYETDAAAARRPVVILLPSVAVSGVGIGGSAQSVRVADDGTFTLSNMFGPRVIRAGLMLADARSAWWPGPVLLDGRDITNVPTEFERYPSVELEVVFTQHYTGVSGIAFDPAGLTSPKAYVIVLSSDSALWQPWSSTTTIVRADDDGRFFLDAPPGNYLAVALPAEAFRSRAEAQQDFGSLARLSVPVEIVEGQTAQITLTTRILPKPRDRR